MSQRLRGADKKFPFAAQFSFPVHPREPGATARPARVWSVTGLLHSRAV